MWRVLENTPIKRNVLCLVTKAIKKAWSTYDMHLVSKEIWILNQQHAWNIPGSHTLTWMSNQKFVWETHEQMIIARPADSWQMYARVSLSQPGKKCLRFNEGDINKYQKMKKPTQEVTSAGAEVLGSVQSFNLKQCRPVVFVLLGALELWTIFGIAEIAFQWVKSNIWRESVTWQEDICWRNQEQILKKILRTTQRGLQRTESWFIHQNDLLSL